MFTLTQLTSFVAVAEELHFGRAAERLRMTQPPLSRQIQLLESELRVKLLDRTNRSVRLTHAGSAFLTEARAILRQSEQAVLAVRQVSSGIAGSLAIGYTAAGAYAMLDHLLRTAGQVVPGVEIVLREMVTRDQLDALAGSSLDLGLVRPPVTAADLESRPVAGERLLAALPLGHPLASRADPLDVREFDGAEILMYSPVEARYFHELLISVFRAARISPVFIQYLSQVHSMLALVNGGWGVALVPQAASQLRYSGVVFKELELAEDAAVEMSLAWRRNDDNPALHRLLAHL